MIEILSTRRAAHPALQGLPPLCDRYLDQILEYCLERTDRSEAQLVSAPADVLDGNAYAHEVGPLVRRRILTVIPVEAANRTLGNRNTWFFTPRGMRIAREILDGVVVPRAETFTLWMADLADAMREISGIDQPTSVIDPEPWRALYEAGLGTSEAIQTRFAAFLAAEAAR